MPIAAPWPTSSGDHRAANRGRGRAPTRGRIRWTWSAAPGTHLWGPLVDRHGRIHVSSSDATIVLDGDGTFRRSRPRREGSVLVAFLDDGALVFEGRTLACIDERGQASWERTLDHAIRAVRIGPTGDALVHGLERDGHGAVTRIDARGAIVWTVAQAQSRVPGLARTPEMALDDDGILYTVVVARLGDGVSGHDVQIGGLAAYDAEDGRARFVRRADGWMNDVYGRAHGAIVTGRTTWIVDRDGRTDAIEDEGRRERTFTIDGAPVTLVDDDRLAGAPILWQRMGPGTLSGLHVVLDESARMIAATASYDPATPTRLFSLDAGGALAWALTLPSGGGASIALGADATLVVVRGHQVLAIE